MTMLLGRKLFRCTRKCLEYLTVFIICITVQGLLQSLYSLSIEDHAVTKQQKSVDDVARQMRTTHASVTNSPVINQEKLETTRACALNEYRDGLIGKTLQNVKSSLREVNFYAREKEVVRLVQQSLGFINKLMNYLKEDFNTTDFEEYVEPKQPKNVCPEEYKGPLYDFPFRNKGFEPIKCNTSKPLHTLVSILLNFQEPAGTKDRIRTVLKGIERTYPKITVHLAIDKVTSPINVSEFTNLTVLTTYAGQGQYRTAGQIWTLLLKNVTTPYTFIGRDLTHFTNDTRFERLILAAETLNAGIVGGAGRTPNGHWSMGCHQSLLKNFTLSYRSGYFRSQNECVFCSHLTGPFLAETNALRKVGFEPNFGSPVLFEGFFLEAQSRALRILSCPDAMFHVDDASNKYSKRELFIPLAARFKINKLKHANGIIQNYTCKETQEMCDKRTGVAVAPCCLEKLADIVKLFMSVCEENNILCELEEGTLLGAVKLNKVLPWERDADLAFHTANYTALSNLKGEFTKRGYVVDNKGNKSIWCCADGRKAGGIIHITGEGWSVETRGSHMMDSELLILEGMSPTKVFYAGQWVAVPRNPGLHARNRYGREIYKHAQHWIAMRKANGYEDYKTTGFTPCPTPGHHACLDQYLADGNIPFEGDDL